MRLVAALLVALPLLACATLPEPGGGGENLPNAGAGPFRALTLLELGNLRSAPNALEDDEIFTRDPAVIDLDGDPSTFTVAGYFGAAIKQGDKKPAEADPTVVILRYEALDARSFDRSAEPVLSPVEPWEGGVIGAPAVLKVGGEIFLYYAAAGGIGLARSPDGHAFTRVPGPVLGPAPDGWEASRVPRSPGVIHLPDGSWRMFYEVPLGGEDGEDGQGDAASAIGEALSPDGVAWTRLGTAPVLAPGKAAPRQDPPVDDAGVGSPFPILAVSAEGRPLLRLYYGARDQAGNKVIGMAARFEGSEGASFQRGVAPVFGTGEPVGSSEPCVLAWPGFTLLFATAQTSATRTRPAVAVGVAPATVALPPPNPR
jgi:hypothetical protein